MTRTNTLSQRWEKYRPSKALWFWSMVAAAVATIVVGFSVGGWTTGGNAADMAARASREATARLAATICVEKFVSADDAVAQLAALKELSSWARDAFLDDGGWTKLVGVDKPVAGASDLCAKELMAMESLPVRVVEPAATDS